LFRMDFFVLIQSHPDAGENQECPENVNDRMKAFYQRNARRNKQTSHDQRSKDAPEQHAMLVFGRDPKVSEDHQKHEHVVDAQRFLDDVTGQKFERAFAAKEKIDSRVKGKSKRDPDTAPYKRFADRDRVRFPMKDSKIQRK